MTRRTIQRRKCDPGRREEEMVTWMVKSAQGPLKEDYNVFRDVKEELFRSGGGLTENVSREMEIMKNQMQIIQLKGTTTKRKNSLGKQIQDGKES